MPDLIVHSGNHSDSILPNVGTNDNSKEKGSIVHSSKDIEKLLDKVGELTKSTVELQRLIVELKDEVSHLKEKQRLMA